MHGVRAGVKGEMAARAKHREELPGQVASLQQMQERGKDVRQELERRSGGSGRSWSMPDKSEQLKKQEAEELLQLTTKLAALELQVAAMHPKVEN